MGLVYDLTTGGETFKEGKTFPKEGTLKLRCLKGVRISLESLLSSLTGVIFVLVTLVVPPLGGIVSTRPGRAGPDRN